MHYSGVEHSWVFTCADRGGHHVQRRALQQLLPAAHSRLRGPGQPACLGITSSAGNRPHMEASAGHDGASLVVTSVTSEDPACNCLASAWRQLGKLIRCMCHRVEKQMLHACGPAHCRAGHARAILAHCPEYRHEASAQDLLVAMLCLLILRDEYAACRWTCTLQSCPCASHSSSLPRS